MHCEEVEESFVDRYFKDITQRMKADGSLESRSEEFNYLTENEERVRFVQSIDMVHETMVVPQASSSAKKSSELSVKYRNQGNSKFQEKNYQEAYDLYTKSVLVAPDKSPGTDKGSQSDLALAHANRSAALYHLQRHKDCLTDIKLAFAAKYPQDLHYKLYDRQAKCFLTLKQGENAITAFENAKNSLSLSALPVKKRAVWEKDISKGLLFCKELISLAEKDPVDENPTNVEVDRLLVPPSFKMGSNEKYTSLSKDCTVKYSENEGRFIEARGDINPGEVVLVERPFASVLLEEHYTSHCHHCFVRLTNPVACLNCTLAVFCKEECRKKAWSSYHQYECEVLQSIHKSGVGKFGHLALRTVTCKGPEFFHQLKQRLSKEDHKDPETLGCETDGEYKGDSYLPIYHLVGHSHKRAPNDLFIRTLTAVYLLKCLQKSHFFASENINSQDEFLEFIGGLILNHLQSFPCNAHEVSELVLDKNNVATSTCQELGAGIYATLSLFNHSCDPTATRFFYGDTCVVRALKPALNGQKVTDNYGAVYAVHTKAERQAKLKPQYYFSCNCQACQANWPLYDNIEHTTPTWICSQCRETLVTNSSSIDENLQKASCKHCGHDNDLVVKKQALSQATESYYSGLSKLLECRVEGACKELEQALSGLHNNVQLPWRDVNNAEEALKQCYNVKANCYVVAK